MALSLLQGYSSPSEASESDSDDSDDGIVITIDRNVLNGGRPGKRAHVRPVKAKAPPVKVTKREDRERRRIEIENKSGKQQEADFSVKKDEDAVPQQRVSTLDMPHYDLGQTTESPLGSVPLPKAINEMFQQEEEVVDDPALHEGRSRSFAHQANSWATYIYLDVKAFDLEDARDLLLKELDLELIPNPHLSLSKVVSLRHHWLPPLTASLQNSLSHERKFYLGLDKLQVYVNEECSRTFVGLTAGAGWGQLTRPTKKVDTALQEYSLPPFYRPPSFHCSLAWCLGDRRAAIIPRLQKLSLKMVDCLEEDAILVDAVHCKAGNKHFSFKLI